MKELNSIQIENICRLIKYFRFIDTISLNKKIFENISFNKMNREYKFIINICQLIFDNLLINKNDNSAEFYNFIEDERKMAYLFESFVRNFYKKELRGAKVYREDMYWELTGEFVEFLPKM